MLVAAVDEQELDFDWCEIVLELFLVLSVDPRILKNGDFWRAPELAQQFVPARERDQLVVFFALNVVEQGHVGPISEGLLPQFFRTFFTQAASRE